MITNEILERILSERDARHQAELEKIRAQLKLEQLETRLLQIEKRLEEEEPEQEKTIGGFSLTDIVSAYTMIQQSKGGTQ